MSGRGGDGEEGGFVEVCIVGSHRECSPRTKSFIEGKAALVRANGELGDTG